MATRVVRTSEKRSLLQSFPTSGDSDHDFIFKIVVIGDASVGKTCLLQRFRFGTFSELHCTSTIGVDFTIKSIAVDGRNIKVSDFQRRRQIEVKTWAGS